ncbi:hypothetical protein [Hyphomonas oceanitis]|uniref:hypothetical protein n=1 Tax=Hyphomonas oceanitis TaxID=81033 RepID=UPI0012EC7901|nr:hypothetical protein [Hyphomonas oceanitis]
MNAATLFGGISALGLLASGLWIGAVEYDAIQDRVGALESRLGDYDALSEPEGASEIARRLNKLESRVSSLSADTAAVESRVDRIDATTGGATGELGQRLAKLESSVAAMSQRSAAIPKKDGPKPSVNSLTQVSAKSPQENSPSGSNTQTFGQFAVALDRCTIRGSTLECFGTIKYSGPKRSVRFDKCVLRDQNDQTWLPSDYSVAGESVLSEVIKDSVRPNLAAGDHQFKVTFRDLVPENQYTLQFRLDSSYTLSFDNIV